MTARAALALAAVLAAAPGAAAAQPAACPDVLADPVATPLRDAGLDLQRGGCLRTEASATLNTHALIDTPGFRGVLGADLALGARLVVGEHLEIGARVRLVDYAFVVNAVNEVSDVRFGPAALSAAYGAALGSGPAPRARVALIAAAELPYTRDELATVRTSGQLTAAVSAELDRRWTLHARLGALGALAASTGGTSRLLALRAGADLARALGRRATLHGGVETQAGWSGGLDTLMLRTGVQVRIARRWRGLVGIGAPIAGGDRTNAIATFGVARDRP